ncbi:hypothetical protein CSOJ01_07390 [Colletotrichum sojae]|uniref:Uncharacterized protein n=1 Tax=Colletotrichum sojae TaxID=2175907 RepID=A0A8H6J9P1_9PEZI|nr:hypothetical protein CSOJ01_07390 [Colletotrichum sojae]
MTKYSGQGARSPLYSRAFAFHSPCGSGLALPTEIQAEPHCLTCPGGPLGQKTKATRTRRAASSFGFHRPYGCQDILPNPSEFPTPGKAPANSISGRVDGRDVARGDCTATVGLRQGRVCLGIMRDGLWRRSSSLEPSRPTYPSASGENTGVVYCGQLVSPTFSIILPQLSRYNGRAEYGKALQLSPKSGVTLYDSVWTASRSIRRTGMEEQGGFTITVAICVSLVMVRSRQGPAVYRTVPESGVAREIKRAVNWQPQPNGSTPEYSGMDCLMDLLWAAINVVDTGDILSYICTVLALAVELSPEGHKDLIEELERCTIIRNANFKLPAFGKLETCAAMEGSLWHRPSFALFSPSQRGRRRSALDAEENRSGFDAAKSIKNRCGQKEWSHKDGMDWFWCEASDYFRIKFTPSKNDEIPLDSLLSFKIKLPIGRPCSDDRIKLYSFVLIAAVWERAAPNEPDYIRLFQPDGPDFFPVFPVVEENYSDGDWKIGAPGHTYNLYDSRTHEVFDPPISEERALMREAWRQMKAQENAKDSPETFLEQAMDIMHFRRDTAYDVKGGGGEGHGVAGSGANGNSTGGNVASGRGRSHRARGGRRTRGNVSSRSGGNVGANGSYGAGRNVVPRPDEANDASIESLGHLKSTEYPLMPTAEDFPPMEESTKFAPSFRMCFNRDNYEWSKIRIIKRDRQ